MPPAKTHLTSFHGVCALHAALRSLGLRVADMPAAALASPHSSSPKGKLLNSPGGKEIIFELAAPNIWVWQPGAQVTDLGQWVLSPVQNPFSTGTGRWFPEHLRGLGVFWALVFTTNTAPNVPQSIVWKPPAGF